MTNEITRQRDVTALESWQIGELSDLEALRALAMQLGEVESDLEPLTLERTYLREAISTIIARLPRQKAEVAGFGALAITGGGETVSYDAKALDSLMAKLLAEGYTQLAGAIADARKTSTRAASLRVTREKAK
jgi:hypothetical protein